MAKLTDPITILKGVGPAMAKKFAVLGIHTLQDLICHFPRGYEDRTRLVTIEKLETDRPACFRAMVMNTPRTAHIRKGLDVTKVQVADHTARLTLTFFNRKFATEQLQYGKEYIFYGAVTGDFIGYNMTSPVFEAVDTPPVQTRRVMPKVARYRASLPRTTWSSSGVSALPSTQMPTDWPVAVIRRSSPPSARRNSSVQKKAPWLFCRSRMSSRPVTCSGCAARKFR